MWDFHFCSWYSSWIALENDFFWYSRYHTKQLKPSTSKLTNLVPSWQILDSFRFKLAMLVMITSSCFKFACASSKRSTLLWTLKDKKWRNYVHVKQPGSWESYWWLKHGNWLVTPMSKWDFLTKMQWCAFIIQPTQNLHYSTPLIALGKMTAMSWWYWNQSSLMLTSW